VSELAFFAQVVARGTVHGLDCSSTPDQVTARLGDFGENLRHNLMWRDHGLVEFTWERPSRNEPWQGCQFTVQCHRLEHGLTPVPTFADLRTALTTLDCEVEEITPLTSDLDEYWQPESRVAILVGTRDGTLHQITGPVAPDYANLRRGLRSSRTERDQIRHLLDASDEDRLRWIGRNQPHGCERPAWWTGKLAVIDGTVSATPDKQLPCARLLLWMIQQSNELEVFDHAQRAERMAALSANLRWHLGPDELADLLPNADDIVRACLAALPEAGQVDSHRVRHLLNSCAPLRDQLDDALLCRELDRLLTLTHRTW
jgi:hypothetical protein